MFTEVAISTEPLLLTDTIKVFLNSTATKPCELIITLNPINICSVTNYVRGYLFNYLLSYNFLMTRLGH